MKRKLDFGLNPTINSLEKRYDRLSKKKYNKKPLLGIIAFLFMIVFLAVAGLELYFGLSAVLEANATTDENTGNNDETAENKGYYANLKYLVSSVKAIDEDTVQIKASRGYYGLLYALTYPILPSGYAGTENPPGTGAYVITTFEPQDHVYLQSNSNW